MSDLLEASAPAVAWVGLLGVVVGSALSILGIWLTNRANTKQLNIQLDYEKSTNSNLRKKEKLEELYVLIDKWLGAIFSDYLRLTLVMRGEIDYNQYLDQTIESGNQNNVDFSRLGMIVDIYGHELQSSYKTIIDARSELNDISIAHKRAYKNGDIDGSKYLKPYMDASIKIEELAELFKKEIAVYAKNV